MIRTHRSMLPTLVMATVLAVVRRSLTVMVLGLTRKRMMKKKWKQAKKHRAKRCIFSCSLPKCLRICNSQRLKSEIKYEILFCFKTLDLLAAVIAFLLTIYCCFCCCCCFWFLKFTNFVGNLVFKVSLSS